MPGVNVKESLLLKETNINSTELHARDFSFTVIIILSSIRPNKAHYGYYKVESSHTPSPFPTHELHKA
jgi:hypothetical protein